MLDNEQMRFLSNIAHLDIYNYGDIIMGVNNRKHKNAEIKVPYSDFKYNMKRDDLRFQWMATDKAFMAGGSVLNWIWGENKNEDFDFFFTNKIASDNFQLFIKGYGFENTKDTNYAKTFFHPEEKVILQVVGNTLDWKSVVDKKTRFVPFGSCEDVLKNFDLEVCKFAVDGDNIYTTVGAVKSLITMRTSIEETSLNSTSRAFKYSRKGFYIYGKSSKLEWRI